MATHLILKKQRPKCKLSPQQKSPQHKISVISPNLPAKKPARTAAKKQPPKQADDSEEPDLARILSQDDQQVKVK